MIISRTPYRVSFFGGGSDYPAWYREHGGRVLGTTIDKYCYLTCRYLPPFFEHRYRIVYAQIENALKIEDIKHPAVREVFKYMGIERSLEVHHDGDLPARSGMGSSSSFVVGLLSALHGLRGKMCSKKELAQEAIHIEQNVLKEVVGSQDQVLAAHGGFNVVEFTQNDDFVVTPVHVGPERLNLLNDHLMLFYTGLIRMSTDVASSYVSSIAKKDKQIKLYDEMLSEALNILNGSGSMKSFGELLHEAWLVKKSLSSTISSEKIDEIYEGARNAGATGGKLLGAGGGGFLLIFAEPEKQEAIREKLDKFIEIPIRFETQGTQVIYYDKQTDYSRQDYNRLTKEINPFEEVSLGAN